MTVPTDLTGLVSWFKADSLALADGAAVATWTDNSGGARDATQATSGNRPIYKTSIVNSKPVVRFPDTTDELAVVTAGVYLGTTMFAVARPPSTSGDYALRRHFENGGIEWRVTGGVLGLDKRGQANIINGTTTLSTANFSVLSLFADSTTDLYQLYVNGTLDGSSLAGEGVGADGAYTIGNTNTDGNFDIAELVIYNRVLDSTERAQIHTYLSDRYAVTVSDYISTARGRPAATRRQRIRPLLVR